MSRFEVGADTSASRSPVSYDAYTDSDNEDDLPYPGELPRKDFLNPDFNPQTYLSTLRNRHQTLEDLRSDLRQRSQLLNQELLDLVNNNYEQFLGLGADLKGGDEKVEAVRVGLLGFEREVDAIRRGVKERREEVGRLLEDKKKVRRDIVFGRGLLEVESSISELEDRLNITKREDGMIRDESSGSEDDEDEDARNGNAIDTHNIPVRKLQRHIEQYVLLTRLIQRLGPEHPFLQAQESRLSVLRRALLLNLRAAMQQAKAAKAPDAILSVLRLHALLDPESNTLKSLTRG